MDEYNEPNQRFTKYRISRNYIKDLLARLLFSSLKICIANITSHLEIMYVYNIIDKNRNNFVSLNFDAKF